MSSGMRLQSQSRTTPSTMTFNYKVVYLNDAEITESLCT